MELSYNKAYNGDEIFRTRFLEELKKHHDRDQLAKGTYGTRFDDSGLPTSWRGCAVGCSIRSLEILEHGEPDPQNWSYGRHHVLAEKLNIPIELTFLEDAVFENLPDKDSLEWPMRFGEAIRCGADLRTVWPDLGLWLLEQQVPVFFVQKEKEALASYFKALRSGLTEKEREAYEDTLDERTSVPGDHHDSPRWYSCWAGLADPRRSAVENFIFAEYEAFNGSGYPEQAIAIADKLIELIKAC
jgi:hypothetical protein